jgi:hypothetical protein
MLILENLKIEGETRMIKILNIQAAVDELNEKWKKEGYPHDAREQLEYVKAGLIEDKVNEIVEWINGFEERLAAASKLVEKFAKETT